MTYWQAPDRDRGSIGCAVVLPAGSIRKIVLESASVPEVASDKRLVPGVEGLPPIGNMLAITQVNIDKPLIYYFGAGWSKSGDFPDEAAWNAYVGHFSACAGSPLKVAIAP